MAVEIKVPDLGESVLEATIARWLKNEGDPVSAGEPVVELETDKVNLEVGAQQAGVLQKIARQAGETVNVGEVLGTLGEGSRQQTAASSQRDEGSSQEAVVSSGQTVGSRQPAGGSGGQGGESQEAVREEQPTQKNQQPAATPLALRMAQEEGIDLAQVKPGGSGRITKEDVQAYMEGGRRGEKEAASRQQTAGSHEREAVSGEPLAVSGQQAADVGRQGVESQATAARGQGGVSDQQEPVTRVPMSRRRQTIARRLVEAQQTAAMLTTFNEIDMSKVVELRKRRREGFKERFGVDLGFMSFFVKAVVGALKAFPYLNAEIQGNEIVLKHYYDIGIAVGAEEGLVVPVVRGADRMNFAEIEKAIRGMIDKVQNGTLALEDLRGGTFTITNGGVYGSLLSTPILNPPQVGILGMHRMQDRPVVVDGQVVVRPMMYVALSYDHRIVDGREAVQFLVRVKELVEDPEAMLLG